MLKLHKFISLIAVSLLIPMVLTSVQAQESTPPTVVDITAEQPTQEPSATPTLEAPTQEVTLAPTSEVTVEVPTEAPTTTATLDEQPTLVGTEPVVVPSATSIIPVLPPEPMLRLLARDLFDLGDLSGWLPAAGWAFTPNETGLGIQTTNAEAPLQLVRSPFANAAAQVSVQMTGGTVFLTLRQSETGGYSAGLSANGSLTLYRAAVPVQSVAVSLMPSQWHELGLAVMDGVVRITLNDVELIAWQDSAQLPPGGVEMMVYPPQDGAPFSVQLDNFFLWVPEAEYNLYTPPTAIPVTAAPTEMPPSPVPVTPTEEVVEPTVTPLPTDVPLPTTTSTATATPELTMTASPTTPPPVDPATGKSQSPIANVPPDQVGTTALDQPTDAQDVTLPLPFSSTDSTTGNDTTGEENLALPCGFNITATAWYRFTPETTRKYILTTAGSTFDTILVVYPDSSGVPAELPTNAIGCNDDVSKTDFTSRLELTLTAGQTYWIRLGGYNGGNGTFTFAVQDTTVPVPAVPRLSSPANNLSSNSSDQLFEWLPPTTGVTPDYYEIQISTTSNFVSLVNSATLSVDETSHSFTLNDGTYFWHVRALNANHAGGAWSAPWKFTLDTVAPDAPILSTPVHTAVLAATRPTLTWKTVAGANRYRVTLMDSEDLANPILNQIETNAVSFALSASVLPQPLQHGKTYIWYVAARDAAMNWGEDSAQRSFSINLLTAPADEITVTVADKRPTFTWSAAGFTGVQYVLEINDTDDFSGAIWYTSPELTTTSHKITLTLPDVTPPRYYWRLRVLNHSNGESMNTPARSFVWATSVPPVVTLLTPANKGFASADPVALVWKPLADTLLGSPFTYDVQVATDSTFLTGLISSTDITADEVSASITNLSPGLYYWRVRAVNESTAPGVWSATWSFTVDRDPPNPPTLKAPLTAAVLNLPRPTLTWNAVTGATRYRVQLQVQGTTNSLLLTGKDLVTTPSLALNTTVITAPLQHGVAYEWFITALDAAGNESLPSETWTFTVNLMNAPANSTSLIMSTVAGRPTFSWVAAGFTGAAYRVEVSTLPDDFSSPYVCTATSTTCRLPIGQELPDVGIYYWRLLVLSDGIAGTPQTETVPTRSFALTTNVPGAPRLTIPTSGTAFNILPTLNWSIPTGTFANYELQIASNNQFTTLIPDAPFSIPADTTSYVPTSPLVDGTYYWRVRAINDDGAWGAWSGVNSFVMDTENPTGVTSLVDPANRSSFAGSQPKFTWKAVTGAKFYEVQLGNSSDFDTVPSMRFIATTTNFTPPGPLLYTTYYWRVRVRDAAGNNGDWSITNEVKITSAPTAVTILNYYTTLPTLTWTPISWAEAYEIQISTNTTFSGVLAYQDADLPSTSTSFQMSTPLPNGTYYWRVRAQKADGTGGVWSVGVGVFQLQISP